MTMYKKELIIVVLQLAMFYIFPLFAGPTDVMGMIVVTIFTTLLLAALLGAISTQKLVYSYPFVISVLFLPSVLLYYNETSLIYAVWYFVLAAVGLMLGKLCSMLIRKVT